MSIGLVVYFAYSYSHSKLGAETSAESEAYQDAAQNYAPPVAAIIAVVLTIALTLYQVPYLMDLRSEAIPINLVIRLFAWIVTGVLVAVLMYGKKSARGGARSPQVKTIGLALSVVNLLIWAGITYWFFVHYAELHGKM
jgi:hypothetical protein